MKNKILVTGCESCPMYGFEEGFYHHCNFYDKYFEIEGLQPKGAQRPDFCNVKKMSVVEKK